MRGMRQMSVRKGHNWIRVCCDLLNSLLPRFRSVRAALQRGALKAGVLVQNAYFSGRLQGYFESLIERDVLKRVI
jgi:hypothetical protein